MQLAESFTLFCSAAADFEKAEAVRMDDLRRLESLLARLRLERMKSAAQHDTIVGEITLAAKQLGDARTREHRLRDEIVFLEKTAVDRRAGDARADVARSNEALATANRRLRAAHAADIKGASINNSVNSPSCRDSDVRRDRVVPIAMERVAGEVEGGHLFI